MLGKPWDLVERPLLRPVSEHHQDLKVPGALHAHAYGLCGQEIRMQMYRELIGSL